MSSGNSSVTLAEECEGWVARFETWNINEDDPQRLEDRRIALDPLEVGSHVRTFLAYVKLAEGKDTQAKSRMGQVRHQWALPFPTTISSNIEVAIVLKTLYILGPSSARLPLRGGLYPKPVPSIIIPTGRVEPRTPIPQVRQDLHELPTTTMPQAGSSSKGLHVSYSYSFVISRNNRYILYKDSMGVNLPQYSTPAVTSLALFELDMSENNRTCYPISHFGGNSAQMFLNACSFHPDLPLVLFHSRSFVSGSSIMLWSFTSKEPRIYPTQNQFLNQEQQESFSDAISTFLPTRSGVEYLNFSACGTQVIVKFCGRFLPEVHSIKSDPVYQWALKQNKAQSREHGPLGTQKHHRSNFSNGGELAVASHPKSLGLDRIVANDSSSHGVVLSSSRSKREIQVIQRSEGVEEAQPLVSLPNWEGIDDINISITTPSTRDERVKIILNKAAKPWYSLSDSPDVNLPAIVQKDTRALVPSRKRNAKGQLLSEAPGNGDWGDWNSRLALEQNMSDFDSNEGPILQ
jgi:hypothetical protein